MINKIFGNKGLPSKKFKSNHKEIFPGVGFFNVKKKKELEDILGLKINNINYFEQAFTHRSFLQIQGQEEIESNQRMEFFGDSILGMVVGEYLFHTKPEQQEGELTKLRSAYVNNNTLAKCAYNLNLKKFIALSFSAEKSLGKGADSILSDLVEAIVAAVYLDNNLMVVRKFIHDKLMPTMRENKEVVNKNYKSILLEKTQAKIKLNPTYKVLKEIGPDHNKEFEVGVYINGEQKGKGSGKNKKTAEQNAAKNALEKTK